MAHIIRAQTVPSRVGERAITPVPNADDADVTIYEEDDHKPYHNRCGTLTQVTREYVNSQNTKRPRRMVVFAKTNSFANYVDNGFFPPRFMSVVEKDLNGTFGIYHHEDTIPGASTEPTYDTWSTFKIKHTNQGDKMAIDYHWSQISVLVRQFHRRQFILFVDCPEEVEEQILMSLSRGEARLSDVEDPFAWHTVLAEGLKDVYDSAVWNMRDIVRNREKGRDKAWFKPGQTFAIGETGEKKTGTPSFYAPDFPFLKEVARHLTHINEAFDVALDTLESVMYHHIHFFNERQRLRVAAGKSLQTHQSLEEQEEQRLKAHHRVQERLYIVSKEIKAIRARAKTLSERLYNEIDLFNHQLSIVIAESARRDNATMKALTLIGVIYLPGTFISGIFGCNFFNYNPSHAETDWNMSDRFWIYWAVTIPLTILTFFVWLMLDEIVVLCRRGMKWIPQFISKHMHRSLSSSQPPDLSNRVKKKINLDVDKV